MCNHKSLISSMIWLSRRRLDHDLIDAGALVDLINNLLKPATTCWGLGGSV